MIRVRLLATRVLCVAGWYAMWGWFIGLCVWGWAMPWEVFRWPLTAVITAITGWPLSRWLDPRPERTDEG